MNKNNNVTNHEIYTISDAVHETHSCTCENKGCDLITNYFYFLGIGYVE